MNRLSISGLFVLLQFLALYHSSVAVCPITDDISIIYSIVNGVGPASKIWVEDLLWWWQTYDPSVRYLGMSAEAMQACDLASFPNLKVYINPGGDAYSQLTALGTEGAAHIKNFVTRDQSKSSSAYVGFCAGGYIASHDYLWETIYEGPGYYNYVETPPLSLFPHTVEGSIVDINDDQYADQQGSKYRAVNVSNGHTMLYYGGSTFGWNGVPAYADKASADFDPNLEVLVYYTDFYGYNSVNIPAAWRYAPTGEHKNLLLTSVHPEADNCTNAQDSDCPPPESLHTVDILRNRAWLCEYINQAAGTSFTVPPVPVAPSFNTSAPHVSYPTYPCYADTSSGVPLFCDTFDSVWGRVPQGLSPQFQRNQTNYERVFPWNTTFISEWGGVQYAAPYAGDGYAVNVPGVEAILSTASILTKPFPLSTWTAKCSAVRISYAYAGRSSTGGALYVEYLQSETAAGQETWVGLQTHYLGAGPTAPWETSASFLSLSSELLGAEQSRLRFTCSAGRVSGSFCALDSLLVTCVA